LVRRRKPRHRQRARCWLRWRNGATEDAPHKGPAWQYPTCLSVVRTAAMACRASGQHPDGPPQHRVRRPSQKTARPRCGTCWTL